MGSIEFRERVEGERRGKKFPSSLSVSSSSVSLSLSVLPVSIAPALAFSFFTSFSCRTFDALPFFE
jgi:hypothetical protein